VIYNKMNLAQQTQCESSDFFQKLQLYAIGTKSVILSLTSPDMRIFFHCLICKVYFLKLLPVCITNLEYKDILEKCIRISAYH